MDSLISTKLRPARSRPRLVARPRLSQRLDPEHGRRLTLVSAPAGFGKTTLLGGWWERRQDSERCTAWLSLYECDNDPARFLAYLVAAVQTIAPHLGAGVVGVLQGPQPPPTEAVLLTAASSAKESSHTVSASLPAHWSCGAGLRLPGAIHTVPL